jgi:uncharacterized membrane protein YeaQ/YmgE (transglycosylase-associated protein family)
MSKKLGIFFRVIIIGIIFGAIAKKITDFVRNKFSNYTVWVLFIVGSVLTWLFILSIYYIGKKKGYDSC